MTDKKFRSLEAFKSFEQRGSAAQASSAGGQAGASGEVSPLRVLAAVKRHLDGVQRADLALELQAAPAAVDSAILRLLQEDLIVTRKDKDGRDLLFAS